MENRFSIGEMSKLNHVPIKTLRYYDEIGLFKPIEVDENSGYRYYSTEQFEQLHIICYLKSLNIPLKQIKSCLEIGNIDDFLNLLEYEKKITEEKIQTLTYIHHQFETRIKEIKRSRNIKVLDKVIIKNLEERKILDLKEEIHLGPSFEMSLRKLQRISNHTSYLMIGKVGLSMSLKSLKNLVLDQYQSVFILLEEEEFKDHPLARTLRKGLYATIFYRGKDHKQSSQYYLKLLKYLDENNYILVGDAIERVIIDQYISKNKEDYLTEIQIPIRKA